MAQPVRRGTLSKVLCNTRSRLIALWATCACPRACLCLEGMFSSHTHTKPTRKDPILPYRHCSCRRSHLRHGRGTVHHHRTSWNSLYRPLLLKPSCRVSSRPDAAEAAVERCLRWLEACSDAWHRSCRQHRRELFVPGDADFMVRRLNCTRL